jgi:hypothetical protein
MRTAAGTNVYFVPNFHPGQASTAPIDGGFNWMVGGSLPRADTVGVDSAYRRGPMTETTRRPSPASRSAWRTETTRT